jgi:Uroporphyrinogen decarboxylase (URO-D)
MFSVRQTIVATCSCLLYVAVNAFSPMGVSSRSQSKISMLAEFAAGDADILVRAFRGEVVERTPVWLMRQVLELATRLVSNYCSLCNDSFGSYDE